MGSSVGGGGDAARGGGGSGGPSGGGSSSEEGTGMMSRTGDKGVGNETYTGF